VIDDGPVARRLFRLEKKCDTEVGHKHNHDHTTMCLRGQLAVFTIAADGTETLLAELGLYSTAVIKAGVEHKLKALSDAGADYACIYSHRDFGGVVVQRYEGNKAAYI
jgi:quercetin dioxygenase-like cupin family protein